MTDKQRAVVEAAAQAVLDARAEFPTSTLADLYDPLTMPAPLLKAHQELDRAVDRCYRSEPFPSDRHRVEYLFALYEKSPPRWCRRQIEKEAAISRNNAVAAATKQRWRRFHPDYGSWPK